MTRQRLLDLSQLGQRVARDVQGVFLVEGARSVASALEAGAPVEAVFVVEGAAGADGVAASALAAGVAIEMVGAREMARIADTATPGGVAAVVRRVAHDGADALRALTRAGLASAVVLDGVQDPGNVGAVVRTAAWFGVEAVVAAGPSADPEGPKAVRAAMGGLWDVALVRVPETADALEALRASGLALWGGDMHGVSVRAWQPAAKAALVLGSEAHGLSPAAAERLDGRVTVGRPAGAAGRGVESLNVVVAAGVLLAAWR